MNSLRIMLKLYQESKQHHSLFTDMFFYAIFSITSDFHGFIESGFFILWKADSVSPSGLTESRTLIMKRQCQQIIHGDHMSTTEAQGRWPGEPEGIRPPLCCWRCGVLAWPLHCHGSRLPSASTWFMKLQVNPYWQEGRGLGLPFHTREVSR